VGLSLDDGKAHKCTLCYDRLKGGLEPACPTDSILFGELSELFDRALEEKPELHHEEVREVLHCMWWGFITTGFAKLVT